MSNSGSRRRGPRSTDAPHRSGSRGLPRILVAVIQAAWLVFGVAPSTRSRTFVLADDAPSADSTAALERAAAAAEKAYGRDDPRVASAWQDLGQAHLKAKRIAEAVEPLRRAATILEQAAGLASKDAVWAWLAAADAMRVSGRYDDAKAVCARLVPVLAAGIGSDASAAGANSQLGFILWELGLREVGLVVSERALAMREHLFPPTHPDVAESLGNVAGAWWTLGDVEKASVLMRRAVAIHDLGPSSHKLALAHGNLAVMLWQSGEAEEALVHFRRSLEVREQVFGPDDDEVVFILLQMARALAATGHLEEARAAVSRVAGIYDRKQTPDSRRATALFVVLARLAEADGELERAVALRRRIVEDYQRGLSEERPELASSLVSLADVLAAHGEIDAAGPAFRRALGLVEAQGRRSLVSLEGRARVARVRMLRQALDAFLRAAPALGVTGYEEVLRFKGLATRIDAAQRWLEREAGPDVRARVAALGALQARLGAMANAPPLAADVAARTRWQADYAAAADEAKERSRALATELAPYREALEGRESALSDVRAALAPGDALVDTLRTGDRYLAWIVAREGDVVRVELGDAVEIESRSADFAERVAEEETADDAKEREAAGRRLRTLVLAPIESRLPTGTTRIVLCPDAALAAVPFAALPGAVEGKTLLDERRLALVAMAQDVVPSRRDRPTRRGALLVGDVDFDHARGLPTAPVAPSLASAPTSGRTRAPAGGTFVPLPATRAEIAGLAARLGDGAIVLTGSGATERAFKSAVGACRFLHVATHGRVRTDLRSALTAPGKESRWFGGAAEAALVGHDPLLLAGLAFAGANPRDGGGDDDGILTAREASYLDLSGCESVVLSACETAAGVAQSGEGVQGLVQAFQDAGALSVVASLRKVDDDATAMLMSRFYDGVLSATSPRSPSDALRDASLWLRDQKVDGRSFARPKYWAVFVAYERR